MIQHALHLASLGFYIFPGEITAKGQKKPLWIGWQEDASCDPDYLRAVWAQVPHALPCISTSYYAKDELWHLLVLDIDNKKGRAGDRFIFAHVEQLPRTYTQATPTGGWHIFYKTRTKYGNTVGVLGDGVDTRGWHGLVVGSGAEIPGVGAYSVAVAAEVADCPAWLGDLAELAQAPSAPSTQDYAAPGGVDQLAAGIRAQEYLDALPVAQPGALSLSLLKAATICRRFGLSYDDVVLQLVLHFKSATEIPVEDVQRVARDAFKYAAGEVGSAAPEVIFRSGHKEATVEEPAPTSGTPIDWFNESHAFVLAGGAGNILFRTTDAEDRPKLKVLSIDAFHNFHAGKTVQVGDEKPKQLSRMWMMSPRRLTFEGMEFAPGRQLSPRYYNLWRGFAFEPQQVGAETTARSREVLEAFKYHVLNNVCGGNPLLAHHQTAWFAHMIQKPGVKPLTSVVIRGGQGTGKDTLLNLIGALLGSHYMSTPKRRFLVGDFNSHLQQLLLFVLNEAFWAHDKAIQAILKDLVTGDTHTIEMKYCEPYSVKNLLRLCVMGNESVQVPADQDERRWLVLDMTPVPTDAAKRARAKFCTELREGMEAGGYPLLMRYLLDYDFSDININLAPSTEGLIEQKMDSLDPMYLWWKECLTAGRIVGADFSSGWPVDDQNRSRVDKELVRGAIHRWREQHKIGGREPAEHVVGRLLRKAVPTLDGTLKRTEKGHPINQYGLPALAEAREMWDRFIGAPTPTKW